MKKLILIPVCISFGLLQAQEAEQSVREGNVFYRQQQFEKAGGAYQKALNTDPANAKAKYNLANTLQKQGKQEEAIKGYSELAATVKEKEQQANAFYNKGVVLSGQKKLEESIDAYKNALRRNPADKEARENLQKALLELKKKNPPKKEEKKDPKKQQQKKQQQQPKMSPKEAEQRLKLLEQKEKEVNQRLQKEKSKSGGSQVKDW